MEILSAVTCFLTRAGTFSVYGDSVILLELKVEEILRASFPSSLMDNIEALFYVDLIEILSATCFANTYGGDTNPRQCVEDPNAIVFVHPTHSK
jgi:hypothetical protein